MDRKAAVDIIRSSPFANRADELIAQLRPSIRVRTRLAYDEAEDRETKFGGRPLVPEDFEWPLWNATAWFQSKAAFYHRRKAQNPKASQWCDESLAHIEDKLKAPYYYLAFLAQLQLSKLPEIAGMPRDGWLLFFRDVANSPGGFDPASRGASRVLWISEHQALTLAQLPEEIEYAFFDSPCALDFEIEQTLPLDLRSYGIELHAWDDESPYRALVESLIDKSEPIHRIAGFPEAIQNPMELECQLVSHGLYCGDSSGYRDPRASSLTAGAADWRLLLQLDSDDDVDWMWGDAGRLYFWIRNDDLRRAAFENVWCIEQCY